MPETDLFREITALPTEQKNPASENIDKASIMEILEIINNEDQKVALAVHKEINKITKAVEMIVEAFHKGGRLIYAGAGTSGRLGILDASECPPTFGTSPGMVVGVIAGGKEAVFQAQEGAEDEPTNGRKVLLELKITNNDVVCGIAASGRTPFVIGALAEARRQGCKTIFVTTSKNYKDSDGTIANVIICPDVGPEVITGSTRMKSGTAQKLVLNMLTTASMVRLGKTWGNVMIDMQLTNAKLKERAKKIIMSLANVDYDMAGKYLTDSGGHVKTALIMLHTGLSAKESRDLLVKSNGFVREAIEIFNE